MPTAGSLSSTLNNDLYIVLITNGNAGLPNVASATSGNSTSAVNGSAAGSGPNSTGEEISTIFVVGFPEDMQEREFQNMFTFSSGFEAATLKVPSKDQDDDTGTTNASGRKQIIGFAKFRSRAEAMEAKDILSGRKVDAEKGSVLKAEMAKKNLHTKRGLSSDQQQHHLPLHHNHHIQQQQPSLQQQHIQLSQSTNHNNQPPIMPLPSNPFPPQQTSSRFPLSPTHQAAYEAFYSVPPLLPSDLLPPSELAYSDFYSADPFSPGGTPTVPTFHDSVFAARAPPFERASSMGDIFVTGNGFGPGLMSPTSSSRIGGSFSRYSSKSYLDMENDAFKHPPGPLDRGHHPMTLYGQGPTNGLGPFSPTHLSFPSIDPGHLGTSNSNAVAFSPPSSARGLNSIMEEVYPLAQPHDNSSSPDKLPDDSAINSRFTSLSISTSTASHAVNNGIPSPGITSPTNFRSFSDLGISNDNGNNTDHNPPCNTLYVGNLPPNASEDELKALFVKCAGYKRHTFRNKSNGPMCFVEFDDVAYATQAMQELQRNPLSSSTKGGIRLSFSKNPLGIRQISNTLATDSFNRNQQQPTFES